MDKEKRDKAIAYLKIASKGLSTAFVINTGCVLDSEPDFIDKAIDDSPTEVIDLDKYTKVSDLWKRLHEADPDKIWIVENVQLVKDDYVKEVVYFMMKREEYCPMCSGCKGYVDFDKCKIILISKGKNIVEAFPEYVRGRLLNSIFVEL